MSIRHQSSRPQRRETVLIRPSFFFRSGRSQSIVRYGAMIPSAETSIEWLDVFLTLRGLYGAFTEMMPNTDPRLPCSVPHMPDPPPGDVPSRLT